MVSEVWKFFEKHEENEKRFGVCKNCKAKISCSNKGTFGLKYHVKSCWKIDLKLDSLTAPSTSGLLSKIPELPLEKLLGSLVAQDGFSMHAIAESSVMQHLFKKYGLDLPKTPSTITAKVKSLYQDCFQSMVNELSSRIKNGDRFSLTGDEWSSSRRRRYVNLNLHNKITYNLGLFRLPPKCSALKLKDLIKDHLSKFEIDVKVHVPGFSSDGCRWMEKTGKLIDPEHTICVNHSLQLGVCDVLYSKKNTSEECADLDQISDSDSDDEFESETDAENDVDDLQDQIVFENEDDTEIELNPCIKENIDNLRKLIKHFRGCEFRNRSLQANIILENPNNHELELHLDQKTRWNSIYQMVERFLKCEKAIRKTLAELGSLQLIDCLNIPLLQSLAQSLEPIAATCTRLQTPNTTIFQADVIFELLCKKLEKMKTELSLAFAKSIKNRYESRKNILLVSLARYLHNPDFLKKEQKKDQYFTYSTKKATQNFAKILMKRLYPDAVESEEDQEDSDGEEESNDSFFSELEEGLKNEMNAAKRPKTFKNFVDELKELETHGIRSDRVVLLSNAIDTIQASSAESERVFSASSRFCTKFRSSLSDENLSILVFLKHYLKNNPIFK